MGEITLKARLEEGGTPRLESWGIDSEYGLLRDVLLGPPESFYWMDGNRNFSSIARATLDSGEKFDRNLAIRQHGEMVDAYESAGVKVHKLEVNEKTPYQVYARDSSFMTPWGAVVTQLANPRRRGEYAGVIQFYASMGIPIYDMVSAGNFEGGDFHIVQPGSVLIGYTGLRCEEVSARQIGSWLEKEGWEVRYAPIDPFYVHIDLMVCMLAERAAAVCLDTTNPEIVTWLEGKGIEIIPVSFRDTMTLGCNVMSLGNDRVLAPEHSHELKSRLRAMGFEVFDPDVSSFTKGGGGVHCMAQSIRRDPA